LLGLATGLESFTLDMANTGTRPHRPHARSDTVEIRDDALVLRKRIPAGGQLIQCDGDIANVRSVDNFRACFR
jgi:hypothetical protein